MIASNTKNARARDVMNVVKAGVGPAVVCRGHMPCYTLSPKPYPPPIGVSGGTTHAKKEYFAKRSHLEFGVFGFFGVGSYSAGAQWRIYDLRSGFGLVRRLTPRNPPLSRGEAARWPLHEI